MWPKVLATAVARGDHPSRDPCRPKATSANQAATRKIPPLRNSGMSPQPPCAASPLRNSRPNASRRHRQRPANPYFQPQIPCFEPAETIDSAFKSFCIQYSSAHRTLHVCKISVKRTRTIRFFLSFWWFFPSYHWLQTLRLCKNVAFAAQLNVIYTYDHLRSERYGSFGFRSQIIGLPRSLSRTSRDRGQCPLTAGWVLL